MLSLPLSIVAWHLARLQSQRLRRWPSVGFRNLTRARCRAIALALAIGVAGGLAACDRWPSRLLTSAAAVQDEQVAGARVELTGSVQKRAPFLNSGAYQLADDSGAVWVVTVQELPAVGDRLRVRGEVDYRSVPADGQEWGGAFVREGERQQVGE